MRILVVDDHPLMTDVLRTVLGTLDQVGEIRTANDLDTAFAIAAGGELDLVMLDLGMPGCTGVEAVQRWRERFPDLPVVVVSGVSEPSTINAALDLGAMGFIPKSAPGEVLLQAVRLVISGAIYVPLEAVHAAAGTPAPGTALDLSPRQHEVLALLLKGLSNKLIARKLDISENTTKIHVSAVLDALGVSTRTQAVIAASRLGLRLDS
ncbi:MAG TPA: response regulator transcription factor [Burkholderiales bacterium]